VQYKINALLYCIAFTCVCVKRREMCS